MKLSQAIKSRALKLIKKEAKYYLEDSSKDRALKITSKQYNSIKKKISSQQ